MGRQCASGLSLLFSARRAFTRSEAQGSIGRPSLNPEPTFLNEALGGVPGGSSGGGAPLGGPPPLAPLGPPGPPGPPRPPAPRRSQIPERSGWPSGALGAGASSFALPSGVRGTAVAG